MTGSYIGILRYVPEGEFQRDDNSQNVSKVSAFRMSEKEIIQKQFVQIMSFNPTSEYFSGDELPVLNVTWYQAIIFCNTLSLLEGLTPVYSIKNSFKPKDWGEPPNPPYTHDPAWDIVVAYWGHNGYRLPTEMEWMWAAMGADARNPKKINTSGYLKPFAGSNGKNSIHSYVKYSGNSIKPHKVGSLKPNELGLYDMSGNIGEWCWDRDGVYPNGYSANYRGPQTGNKRIIRGGSYNYDERYVTIAHRNPSTPNYKYWTRGLRVVRN